MLQSGRLLFSTLIFLGLLSLSGCVIPPKIDGAKCTGNFWGGWWKCEITDGAYKGFKTGMTQKEAYKNICKNGISKHTSYVFLLNSATQNSHDIPLYLRTRGYSGDEICSRELTFYKYDMWSMQYDFPHMLLIFTKGGELYKIKASYSAFQP